MRNSAGRLGPLTGIRADGGHPPGRRRPARARNDTLNRAAFSLGQLVTAGLIPPLPVMTGLAEAAGHAGLPDDKGRRTIRSGMAAGAKKPRVELT